MTGWQARAERVRSTSAAGDLDSGTDNGYVWMECSCGGLIMQPAGE